jgi:hypothetical protein
MEAASLGSGLTSGLSSLAGSHLNHASLFNILKQTPIKKKTDEKSDITNDVTNTTEK